MYAHLINLHFTIYEIVLWLLMPPISEKMGNVIHPQVFTRYGKLQIIFSLPIVHLQYRLHHIDWCFFWAISVYGLLWSGKKRRKLELWRHQNKTKLQTYHREMTLVSYAKATKGFEKGLLIISIRLLIISLFVLHYVSGVTYFFSSTVCISAK